MTKERAEQNEAHIDHHMRLLREELAKERPNSEDVINLGYIITCARLRRDGVEVEMKGGK